jgi:hypothetical protein
MPSIGSTSHLVEPGHERIGAIARLSRLMGDQVCMDRYWGAPEIAGLPVESGTGPGGESPSRGRELPGAGIAEAPDRPALSCTAAA